MLLTDLLKDYKPSYPASQVWADTFQLLESDPSQQFIITDLINDLERDGQFREPVKLEDDGEQKIVGDGTHRVYVAWLTGMTEIPTEHRKYDELNTLSEDYDMFPVTITHLRVISTKSVEDVDESVTTVVRSVKLSNNMWVTSDMFVGSEDSGFYHCYWNGNPGVENHERLDETLCERLKQVGVVAEVKTYFFASEDEMNTTLPY